jgi:hypothetical protein
VLRWIRALKKERAPEAGSLKLVELILGRRPESVYREFWGQQ